MANAPIPRTAEGLNALEQAVVEARGDLLAACRALGVPYRDVCQWRDADPEVAAALHTAQLHGWQSLESAAYERAVNGVQKAVYYQGEVCGYETIYSDGLLSQMLKARVPAYAAPEERPHPGLTVNVAIMPRAASYEEWCVQREAVLSPRLAAPAPVLEAEYTEIRRETALRDVL